MRTVDALKKWCKLSDPAEIEEEVKRFERLVSENAVKNEGQGKAVEVLPGVEELLASLGKAKKEDGPDKWTIVTSCECDQSGLELITNRQQLTHMLLASWSLQSFPYQRASSLPTR